MGKDRRKDKAEEEESLGKKADKFGKKGDGKKDPAAPQSEKSFSHQTCRHILVQKQSEAIRISEEIHNGKITFNEAAFKYSEDKAGAHGLLGDKAQHEVRRHNAVWCRISMPLMPSPLHIQKVCPRSCFHSWIQTFGPRHSPAKKATGSASQSRHSGAGTSLWCRHA